MYHNSCLRGNNSLGPPRLDLTLAAKSGGSAGSRREEAAYLGRHHSLPLGDQFALGTLAVLPLAVALVALQVGHQAVVPTAGALGGPGGFVAPGRVSSGLRDLLHSSASGMLGHRGRGGPSLLLLLLLQVGGGGGKTGDSKVPRSGAAPPGCLCV